MNKEIEPNEVPLSGMHIDFRERSITFEVNEVPVARLRFAPEGVVLYQALTPRNPTEEAGAAADVLPSSPAPLPLVEEPPAVARPEKEKTVTLTGRLKSTPKEGRPDRSGKPTAWARFAAHEEGDDEPHQYLATFHRHTADIALSLKAGAQLTAEGYVHATDDPKRLATFSVFRLHQYPGKPAHPSRSS